MNYTCRYHHSRHPKLYFNLASEFGKFLLHILRIRYLVNSIIHAPSIRTTASNINQVAFILQVVILVEVSEEFPIDNGPIQANVQQLSKTKSIQCLLEIDIKKQQHKNESLDEQKLEPENNKP